MEQKLPEQRVKDLMAATVYPGADPEDIDMAYDYCIARGVDPLQKLVHLVPHEFKKKNGKAEVTYKRTVIWEGIGMYRVIASRTGQYAGQDEPKFGPMREKEFSKTWDGKTTKWVVKYHEWISVTVYRLVDGARCPYTVPVFWEEEFVGGKNPNSMWTKRPIGQHIKVAAAQSLRAAFPEVSQAPSAEEMEGRTIGDEHDDDDHPPANLADSGEVQFPTMKLGPKVDVPLPEATKPEQKAEEPPMLEEPPLDLGPQSATVADAHRTAPSSAPPVSGSMVRVIKRGIGKGPEGTEKKLLAHFKAESIETLPAADINTILAWLNTQ